MRAYLCSKTLLPLNFGRSHKVGGFLGFISGSLGGFLYFFEIYFWGFRKVSEDLVENVARIDLELIGT